MRRFKVEDCITVNEQISKERIDEFLEIEFAKSIESIYNQVYDKHGPEIAQELIEDLFASRTTAELGWPQGKPLPDLNQFVDRSIVNEVLKEMGRSPEGGGVRFVLNRVDAGLLAAQKTGLFDYHGPKNLTHAVCDLLAG